MSLMQSIYPSYNICKYYNCNGYLRGLDQQDRIVKPITAYNPFFPMSFFDMFEIISLIPNRDKNINVVIIVYDSFPLHSAMGWLEAIMMYRSQNYAYAMYDKYELVYVSNPTDKVILNSKIRNVYNIKLIEFRNEIQLNSYIISLLYSLHVIVTTKYHERIMNIAKYFGIDYFLMQPSKIPEVLKPSTTNVSKLMFASFQEYEIEHISNSIEWCNEHKLYMLDTSEVFDNTLSFHSYELKSCCKYGIFPLISDLTDPSPKRFQRLKMKLNIMKRIIDTRPQLEYKQYDKIVKDWNAHTNDIDLLHGLKYTLTNKYHIPNVSNAWTKLYEILNRFPELTDMKSVNSFHICEAPGAFIKSLQHYCNRNNIKLTWLAQTLNPNMNNINMLNDSLGLIKNNSKKWLFGQDDTGNIINTKNIIYYAKKVKNINLITADGGLKIPSTMFNEQESYVSKLILAEIVTTLRILNLHGHAVIKMFIPFSEPQTIAMLYALSLSFKKVHVCKPESSHPSSSEVYVVCIDYVRKFPKSIIKRINRNIPVYPISLISKSFLDSVYDVAKKLVDMQMTSIRRSLVYYEKECNVIEYKTQACTSWINTYLKKKN